MKGPFLSLEESQFGPEALDLGVVASVEILFELDLRLLNVSFKPEFEDSNECSDQDRVADYGRDNLAPGVAPLSISLATGVAVVGPGGLEPPTNGLKVHCSSN